MPADQRKQNSTADSAEPISDENVPATEQPNAPNIVAPAEEEKFSTVTTATEQHESTALAPVSPTSQNLQTLKLHLN